MIRASSFNTDQVVNEAAAPLTGSTVVIGNNSTNRLLVLTPATTLATLTVTLPDEASSRIGQVVRVSTARAITLLTVNGANTILNAPASLALGDNIGFQKTAANTWQRIQ